MAKVNLTILEVLSTLPTSNPATISGAGVTQVVLEVLGTRESSYVRVSQQVIELLVGASEGSGGEGSQYIQPITTAWVTIK